MKIKYYILLIVLVTYSGFAQDKNEIISSQKDKIIGSFSSSIVFLIHSELDLIYINANDFPEQQNYYLSQLKILEIINNNFKNNLDEFIIKGNPSKNDNELLIKLIEFSKIYKKQIDLMKMFIEKNEEKQLEEFSTLHEKMKSNIKSLFNSNN